MYYTYFYLLTQTTQFNGFYFYLKYHEILKPQSFQINILLELQRIMSER